MPPLSRALRGFGLLLACFPIFSTISSSAHAASLALHQGYSTSQRRALVSTEPCTPEHVRVMIDAGMSIPARLRRTLVASVRRVHGSSLASASSGASRFRAATRVLLRAINHDRLLLGLHPLGLDVRESRCSTQHSLHMASRNAISHDQFPQDVCVPHTWSGENVGVAYRSAGASVRALHRMMMNEGPCFQRGCSGGELERHQHYLNLTNPLFSRVGIGIVRQNGTTWLTEDFTG